MIRKLLIIGIVSMLTVGKNSQSQADVKISNLQDYNFGVVTSITTQTIDHTVCVYRSGLLTPSTYTIQATGLHDDADSFNMANGPNKVAYSVFWKDGSPGFVTLTPGVKSQIFQGANVLVSDCLIGILNPAVLRIRVLDTTLASSLAGHYSDTLSLLMAPI